MAYLRKDNEKVEMDFPLKKVWAAISKAVPSIEWTIEETDDAAHRMKAKTKQTLLAYASIVTIEAISVSEKTTHVNVSAETPVTTLTSLVDFGKTRERIDLFLLALVKQLKVKKETTEKAE